MSFFATVVAAFIGSIAATIFLALLKTLARITADQIARERINPELEKANRKIFWNRFSLISDAIYFVAALCGFVMFAWLGYLWWTDQLN